MNGFPFSLNLIESNQQMRATPHCGYAKLMRDLSVPDIMKKALLLLRELRYINIPIQGQKDKNIETVKGILNIL